MIVGGGFTGLAAAYSLAKCGQKTVLLEANHIGYGASSRNAGFCTIGPPASASAVLESYGEIEGARYFRWFLAAVDALHALVVDEALDVDWRVSGRLSLSRSTRQSERLRRNFQIQRELFGFPVAFLEGHDLRDHIGAAGLVSAIADTSSACLNPRKLVSELMRIAAHSGASIHENTAVLELRELPSAVEVRHVRGVVRARHVVVATNGYSRPIGIGAHNFTVPLGSFIVATEPLSQEACKRLLPTGKVASTISNYSNYFRLLDDGTMLFGGRKTLAVDGDLGSIARELTQAARHLFGEAIEIPAVAACWGGRLAFTRDRTPLVGKVTDRILFAGGYCGHGVPTSVSAGLALARYVCDGRYQDCPFFSDAISGSAVNWIGRKLMPVIGLYYRGKDRQELKQT